MTEKEELAALRRLAELETKAKGARQPEPAYDPTEGMSGFGKFVAGYGSVVPNIVRGVGQAVGLVSQADIDEAKRLEAPLMRSGAGAAGSIAGNVAAFIPTVAIPGAATLRGAAALGAGMGAIQPVATGESRLANTAVGGAAGAGGVLAGRALVAGAQGAKALMDPFTQGGRSKIAGRMLLRFADDPAAITAAQGGRTATGAVPTLAEQTGDAGLARLQDSLRSVDPQINNRITQRLSDNNAARVTALQSIAGDSGTRSAAEGARKAATADLYKQATAANYTVDSELSELLSRPVVKQAMERAKTMAANQGRPFAFDVAAFNPLSGAGVTPKAATRQVTGQGLQDLKMALDEMLTDPASGFTGSAGKTVKNLRGQVLNWMERANPDFKAARTAYADLSKPINAMDIGEEISRRATSNTSDLAGNPRMQANALLGMLRDEGRLIERGTGRSGMGDQLSNILSPQQMNLLRSVASEADRTAAVGTAGSGPGSATAQRMASQNILRQLVGPTGLPESWADSVLANTVIGKPFNLLYGGVAEPKIQQALAEAVLDPQVAKQLLAAAQAGGPRLPSGKLADLLTQVGGQAARLTGPALAVSGNR